MLGILQHFELASLKPRVRPGVTFICPGQPVGVCRSGSVCRRSSLYPVPVVGLLAANYLKQRAALIDVKLDSSKVDAGLPQGAAPLASAKAVEFANTIDYSIVDRQGNAVSLTSSIENAFGSGLLVNGYLLNNQMTDFALDPMLDGLAVANRVEALKIPRSLNGADDGIFSGWPIANAGRIPWWQSDHQLCGASAGWDD